MQDKPLKKAGIKWQIAFGQGQEALFQRVDLTATVQINPDYPNVEVKFLSEIANLKTLVGFKQLVDFRTQIAVCHGAGMIEGDVSIA